MSASIAGCADKATNQSKLKLFVSQKAAAERGVITLDLDFGEIVSFSHGSVVSTITFRVHNTRGPFLIRRLEAVLPNIQSLLESGAIVIIEDSRYRVRQLPISD